MSKKNIYTLPTPMRFEEALIFSLYSDFLGEDGPIPDEQKLDFNSFQTKEKKDVYVKNKMKWIKKRGFDAYFAAFGVETEMFLPSQLSHVYEALTTDIRTEVIYILDSLKKKANDMTIKTCKFTELPKTWRDDISEEEKEKHCNDRCLLLNRKGDGQWLYFAKEIIFTSSM